MTPPTAITGNGRSSSMIMLKDLNSKAFRSFETKLINFPTLASLIAKAERVETFSKRTFMKIIRKEAKV